MPESRDVVIVLVRLIVTASGVTVVRRARQGGLRSVIAESMLVKHRPTPRAIPERNWPHRLDLPSPCILHAEDRGRRDG